jgi:hypothetical protein
MIDYDTLLSRATDLHYSMAPDAQEIDVRHYEDYHAIEIAPHVSGAMTAAVQRACDERNVRIRWEQLPDDRCGYYSAYDRLIVISAALAHPMRCVTLVHEFAHSVDPNLPRVSFIAEFLGVSPTRPLNEIATIAASAFLCDRYGIRAERHHAACIAINLWKLRTMGHTDLGGVQPRAIEIYEAGRALLDPWLRRVAA